MDNPRPEDHVRSGLKDLCSDRDRAERRRHHERHNPDYGHEAIDIYNLVRPDYDHGHPSGGTAQTVSNSSFVVTENSAFVILTAAAGFHLNANGSVSVAFQTRQNSGIPVNTIGPVSATIVADRTFGYDSNVANNSDVWRPAYSPF